MLLMITHTLMLKQNFTVVVEVEQLTFWMSCNQWLFKLLINLLNVFSTDWFVKCQKSPTQLPSAQSDILFRPTNSPNLILGKGWHGGAVVSPVTLQQKGPGLCNSLFAAIWITTHIFDFLWGFMKWNGIQSDYLYLYRCPHLPYMFGESWFPLCAIPGHVVSCLLPYVNWDRLELLLTSFEQFLAYRTQI